MSGDRLSGLQWRILGILSGLEPQWTLTGGAALAGVHLKHRTTKDLDLFFRKVGQLGTLPDEVRSRLTKEGLEVSTLRSGATFTQLRVGDGIAVCIVDLVAEPVPSLEPPLQVPIGETVIAVDTPHEILVNKLCALLGRSELRDLEDVRMLLERGGDFERALADAPQKDGGFSPLTLAWVLRGFHPRMLAPAIGLNEAAAERLEQFKQSLIQRLLDSSSPEAAGPI
jgi:hypothetical protein